MEAILVSACLLGADCKYSGGNNLCPRLELLKTHYHLIPVCPEQLGGLPTPRPPAERQGDLVVNNAGEDVTAQFRRGAEEALKLGRFFGCTKAILKTRSPSCGNGEIYDGTFSGVRISGDGFTAQLLKEQGFTLFSEESLPEF